jgi:hypothetical protein
MSNMQAAPAAESEVVQGTVIGIIQKGADKWQVAVQPFGSQYSRNLWTKDSLLVQQLSGLIGTEQAFLCGKSHWVRQDGTPVTSLWINGVGPGAAAPSQPAPSTAAGVAGGTPGVPAPPGPQPAPGWTTVGQVMQGMNLPQQSTTNPGPVQYQQYQQPQRYETPDEKRASIHRQCASKVAACLLAPSILPPDVPRDFGTFLTICERLVAYYEHGVGNPTSDGSGMYSDDDVPF